MFVDGSHGFGRDSRETERLRDGRVVEGVMCGVLTIGSEGHEIEITRLLFSSFKGQGYAERQSSCCDGCVKGKEKRGSGRDVAAILLYQRQWCSKIDIWNKNRRA